MKYIWDFLLLTNSELWKVPVKYELGMSCNDSFESIVTYTEDYVMWGNKIIAAHYCELENKTLLKGEKNEYKVQKVRTYKSSSN